MGADSADLLVSTRVDAQVDLHPRQVEAALYSLVLWQLLASSSYAIGGALKEKLHWQKRQRELEDHRRIHDSMEPSMKNRFTVRVAKVTVKWSIRTFNFFEFEGIGNSQGDKYAD